MSEKTTHKECIQNMTHYSKHCTCGGEIGPRRDEERSYFFQVKICGAWEDCNMAPNTIGHCETIAACFSAEALKNRRIVRRTDEVVREWKGEA